MIASEIERFFVEVTLFIHQRNEVLLLEKVRVQLFVTEELCSKKLQAGTKVFGRLCVSNLYGVLFLVKPVHGK